MKLSMQLASCLLLALVSADELHIKAASGKTSQGLRGGLHSVEPVRKHRPISTLQTSQTMHLQASSASHQALHTASRRSHTWRKLKSMRHHISQGFAKMFNLRTRKKLSKMHQRKTEAERAVYQVGACKNKLKWWILVKNKCVKAFGKDSRWDRDKLNGKCSDAWSSCNTGFYAVCCSQPRGPKTMDAYCEGKAVALANGDKPDKDKACQVQNKMQGIRNVMNGIKNAVGSMHDQDSFGPGPAPGPMPMSNAVMPPPGLVAAVPAPAPMPQPLLTKCQKLTELTRQAAEKIHAIKLWAAKDGIKEEHEKNVLMDPKTDKTEAKDPDLAFSVKGVLHAGDKLDAILKNGDFCDTSDDDDDDLGDDPTTEEDEESDDAEEDQDEPVVNETAIKDLLDWESEMGSAVDFFEKDVHPHGFKWWRYRYQYTMIESLVLAASVMVLYFVMWLLHGVSFFDTSKFYKTGVPQRLHRYAWAYLVFHAASLMVMVTVAYILYIPWGKNNIFDMFADKLRAFVDDDTSVPFLGYSWLYMVLDVQFQLFVTFALYSLFVVCVAHNYKRALEDWKALSDKLVDSAAKSSNVQLYTSLENIMKRRIRNAIDAAEYRQIFHELKLSLPGVPDLEKTGNGWCEFKLHLYLTDGLGKSLEYLVQVSLTTNIFLACAALVVALLAAHYEVAFMYFLPGFFVIGCALFVAGYFVARHYRALSEADDKSTPSKYVNVHSYCRAIQIMLYCLFYSFSRLLLSNDIFEFYPNVYFSALIGLAIVLVALASVAGEVIKDASCALILPPHIKQDEFKRKLQQIEMWHKAEKCHECGVQQLPPHSSFSREWAGRPASERKEAGSPPDTSRPYSWR